MSAESHRQFEKDIEQSQKKRNSTILVIIGLLLAFLLGSVMGPTIDRFQSFFRTDYRTDSTVSGLNFTDVNEKYFPKKINTDDYGGILTTFVPLHLDKFHAGEKLEGKVFMGNITKGDLEVQLESEGPIKVLFDSNKVGKKVVIPTGKQTYIPIVLEAPSEKLKKHESTVLNLAFINEKNVKVKVPIEVEAPRIIPPISNGDTFMDTVQYWYALFVFYVYDYIPILVIIVGAIIIGSISYAIKRKRGKEKDEKEFKMEQSA